MEQYWLGFYSGLLFFVSIWNLYSIYEVKKLRKRSMEILDNLEKIQNKYIEPSEETK